ncbi:MAG: hypothetical protein Q8P12_03025, partial [bacterium]|nr:hypothetical protein [bacterium]
EEPPAHAIFILATTEPHKLPDTIRSRCQRFSFERAPVSQIVEKLEEIVKSEKLKISDVQLEQIAKAAGGGFRDAETLLEQVATGGEEVDKLIGFAKLGELADFLDHLIKKDASQAIFFINNLYNNGVDMSTLAIAILEYLRDLLLIQAGVGDELVDVGREQYEVMKKQAGGLSTRRLEYMINKITQAYEFLSQAAIPTLPLEVAVVELTSEESSADRLPQPEVKAAPAEKKAPPAATSAPPAESDEWSRLMTAVKPLNHSVEALLRSCRLGGVTARAITIQALYDFHKEKLEDAKSQKILSQAIQEVFGKPLKIKVELSGNK